MSSELDVFLCHNSADKPTARRIGEALRSRGLRVWLDVWDLAPGSDWQVEMGAAIRRSRAVAVLIGRGEGPWQKAEMKLAVDLAVRGEKQVIPVLLPGAPGTPDVSEFLRLYTWLDLRAGITPEGIGKLAWGIDGESAREPGEQLPLPRRRPWNVPLRRNPFFTGREDVLSSLREALVQDGAAALGQAQAISGLGGVGKTQVAVEYAYRYRDDYRAVFWVRAESEAEARAGLVEVARLLGLPEAEAPEQEAAVRAARTWLETNDGWLLVLDNADQPEQVAGLLPADHRGHVVVTSRARSLTAIGIKSPLRISTLPIEEATALLIERACREVGEEERAAAAELAAELGGLPLALEQAGAYLEEKETRFLAYLAGYRARRLELLEKGAAKDHPETVAVTWNIETVEEISPGAADVLRACAFLAPDAIPLELLAGLGETTAADEDGVDELALGELLEPLARFSLVEREIEARAVSVHRLVQAVVRAAMDEDTARRRAERVVRALAAAFPSPDFSTWGKCERLAGHARAVAGVVEELGLEMREAGKLLNNAGVYAVYRGRYSEAEPLYRRALAIREQQLGADHLDVSKSLNNLAILNYTRGRYAEAEPLYRRALEIKETQLGADHPGVAKGLNNLAILYVTQGRYADAESLHRRALEIREQQLGADDPDVAQSLSGLAQVYFTQGRHADAEPFSRRALEIKERQLGPDHPGVAQSLHSLAVIYSSQDRPADAEPLFRRALEILEQQLAADHPDVARILNGLAGVYSGQERYADAESLYRRALQIWEKEFGADHPNIARNLGNLANLYVRQGRDADAEPLYRRALEVWKKQRGTNQPDVVLSLNNLALFYIAQGRYADAEPLQRRALEIATRSYGEAHPFVMKIRFQQILGQTPILRDFSRASAKLFRIMKLRRFSKPLILGLVIGMFVQLAGRWLELSLLFWGEGGWPLAAWDTITLAWKTIATFFVFWLYRVTGGFWFKST